ncbi:hypothetical protein B0H14DRAFT_3866535 [Mycena olivaceomarginata]|nr:hypothetical protein B0H14DRAFT_3866535 [Mycena olivaceomarginata]
MQGLYDETAQVYAVQVSESALYLFSRGIRVLCAARSTVGHRFVRTSIRGTPLRSPVALPLSSPRSHNPTIAFTDDALTAVWCAVVETMSWVLSHSRDSPGSASAPPYAHSRRRRDDPALRKL